MAITETSSTDPAGAAASVAPQLVWTAFAYRLPGSNGRARTALWRLLHDRGALNLGQGTWAVPRRGDDPDVTGALDHVHAAGGEAWAHDVGVTGDDDQRLQLRLQEACERLWDSFFNDLDRTSYEVGTDPAGAAAKLTALRDRYSKVLTRDPLISPAAARAERRLVDLTAKIAGDPDVASSDPAVAVVRRQQVGATAVVRLSDGTVRTVVRLQPVATAAWEQAFNAFEDFAYGVSETRLRLRQNTFTVVTPAGQHAAGVAAIQERLERFQASLGA